MRDEEYRLQPFAKALRSRMTEAEVILWSRLRTWREHGFAFRRQHPIGPYIADFACVKRRIVVELDGDQHGSDEGHARDERRDAYMTTRGWRVVRVPNHRIHRELDDVLNILAGLIPPPSPGGDTSPALSAPCGSGVRAPRGRKGESSFP